MKLSHEDVREILSIVEASSFDSIEIQVGDIKLAASKSGPLPRSGAAPAPAAAAAPAAPEAGAAPA
ncbi:acetyl-CoA carboxylase, biotin carboxyl carrier protein, partial [Aquicoccus sp. SCR17]|nr:acetyl-CoA carboxylase, biotin carboxyl carrier protein [Carideicomes alvinocaridis]